MRRMITGEQITKINKLNQVDANPEAEATELLDKVQIGDTVYNLAGGVKTVNGQIGHVVLTASDIKADDQTTIQENIDRIDADITNVSNALDEEVTTRTTQINGVVTAISSLNDAIVAEQQTRSEEIARVEGLIPDITPLATKEEVTAVANDLSNHTNNDTIHVTASDKETWSNKVNQEQIADMATKTDLTNYVDLSTAQTVGGAKTFTAAPVCPNIKAQGTNESTIYGSTQMVHTFKDNTTLNLKYPSKTGDKTIATVDDLSNMVTTDTDQTINANKTIKGTFSIARADGNSTALRIYNDQADNISFAGWKTVNGENVRTWFNLPLSDTKTSKTIATTDQIPTDYVSLAGEQTITGKKTFNDFTKFKSPIRVYGPGEPGVLMDSAIGVNSTGLTRYDICTEDSMVFEHFDLKLPRKEGTLAITSDIPDVSNMATTDTAQTISGHKIFDEGSIDVATSGNTGEALRLYTGGIGIYDTGTANNQRKAYLKLPRTNGTLALTSDIPDVSNFVTKSEIPEADNIVTTNTEQTISAKKTFTNELRSESYIHIQDNTDNSYVQLYADRIEHRDNQGQIRTNYLPGGDGQLATLDQMTGTFVNKTTDQEIRGQKTFWDTLKHREEHILAGSNISCYSNATSDNNNLRYKIYGNQTDGLMIGSYKDVANGANIWRHYKFPVGDANETVTVATLNDIPTDYVSLTGDQTINGKKTFNGGVTAANFTAQGSNQSTIYGGTQFVHTFANNTKLNLQFPVKSGNKTIATVDDIYYQNNEKFVNKGYYSANGYITGAGKQMMITIPLPKNLKNIKSVTVNKFAPVIRGIGGYVNGSQYIDYITTAGYTINPIIAAPNAISFQIIKDTEFGGSNNTPVAFVFNNGGIEMTFNT